MTREKNTKLLLFSLALGTFMSALDTSVVNIALPMIKDFFGVQLGAVEWIVTAYLLVLTCTLMFFGRLSDLLGHRKVYLTGFALFTAGSLLCSLSRSVGLLITFRAFQAMGASMMSSTSGAIITGNMPENRRGKSFGIIAVAVASALCVGPVVGGALAGLFGWQSIFMINIPIGVVGLVLASKAIPHDQKAASAPLDITGGALLSAALFFILLPLNELSNGLSPLLFAVFLLLGFVLLALFILFERKSAHPLVKLKLFSDRTFSAGIAAAVFNYAAQFIMAFLAPFYLQDIRHFSPAVTGLLYLPMPLMTLMAAPIAGSQADRIDTRLLSSVGMGLMAVGVFMMSFVNATTSFAYIIIFMALCGLGSGLFQSPNNTAVMSSAPPDMRGVASGTLGTGRNLGMAVGVALSGAIFTLVSGTGIPSGAVDGAMQSIFLGALHITYVAASCIALLAMAASLVKGRKKVPDQTAATPACEKQEKEPA